MRPDLLSPYSPNGTYLPNTTYAEGKATPMERSYFQLLIQFLSSSIYSLACVNMSKIASWSSRIGSLAVAYPSMPTRVENNGFEPLTPCLQSRCSSQLS